MIDDDLKVYKLFISHVNNDEEEYKLFLDKLSTSIELEWKDYAIKEKNDPEDIFEQIRPVDVVIILSGLFSKDEKLMREQLNAAIQLKKPIVVIRPYGMENVPANLEEIADEVVGWNIPCIVDAIKDAFDK